MNDNSHFSSSPNRLRVMICGRGQCADPIRARQLEQYLGRLITQHGLDDPAHPRHVTCTITNCLAVCKKGPVLILHPEGIKYQQVDEAALERIFQNHILEGHPVEELRVQQVPPRQISAAIDRLLRGN